MKLPRDLSGDEVVRGLRRVGYEIARQKGSHAYMTTHLNGEHHVTVPLHDFLKVGTLSSILDAVAGHLGFNVEELLSKMRP